MKIALITNRPKLADKKTNLKTMEQAINKTKADCYVFGELFLTGYSCKDEWHNLAETLQGPSISFMKKLAQKKQCIIIFGMPLLDEKITSLLYNAAILIKPDGSIHAYKKWFLPNLGPFEEKIFFDEGEETIVVDTPYGKIGLIICYDIYFPELAKALVLQGAEILICISASPSTTKRFFETLIPARAVENTVFMVFTNLTGAQEDLISWGGSQIYDPLGKQLIKAPYYKPSIVTTNLNIKVIQMVRRHRPLLRDIRPEIYQDLYNLSRFHTKNHHQNLVASSSN